VRAPILHADDRLQAIRPFRLEVPQEQLHDLEERLTVPGGRMRYLALPGPMRPGWACEAASGLLAGTYDRVGNAVHALDGNCCAEPNETASIEASRPAARRATALSRPRDAKAPS
jgi:hypothetical protein